MADVDYAFIPKAQILASHAHANLDKDWGPFQSKDAALQSMPNTAVRKAGKKFGVVSTVGGVTTIEEYMFTKDNATDNDVVKLVLSSDDVTGTFDYTIGSTTSEQLSEAISANKIITIGTYIASVGRVGTSSSGYYVVCYTDEDGVFHKIVHGTSTSSVGTETTKEFADVETINSTSELGFSGVIGGIKKYQGNTMLDLGGVSESGTLGNAIKHLISLGVHIDADDTNNVFAIKNINNVTVGSITLGTNATNGAAELTFVAGSDSFVASLPNLAYDSSNQMLKMVEADGTQINLIKLSNLQIKGVGSTLPCWDTTATPDPVSREAKDATGAPHWAIGDLFLLENSSTTPSTFDLCVCTNVVDDGTYYNYSWENIGSINNVSLQADQVEFDNSTNGFEANTVQGVIEEVNDKFSNSLAQVKGTNKQDTLTFTQINQIKRIENLNIPNGAEFDFTIESTDIIDSNAKISAFVSDNGWNDTEKLLIKDNIVIGTTYTTTADRDIHFIKVYLKSGDASELGGGNVVCKVTAKGRLGELESRMDEVESDIDGIESELDDIELYTEVNGANFTQKKYISLSDGDYKEAQSTTNLADETYYRYCGGDIEITEGKTSSLFAYVAYYDETHTFIEAITHSELTALTISEDDIPSTTKYLRFGCLVARVLPVYKFKALTNKEITEELTDIQSSLFNIDTNNIKDGAVTSPKLNSANDYFQLMKVGKLEKSKNLFDIDFVSDVERYGNFVNHYMESSIGTGGGLILTHPIKVEAGKTYAISRNGTLVPTDTSKKSVRNIAFLANADDETALSYTESSNRVNTFTPQSGCNYVRLTFYAEYYSEENKIQVEEGSVATAFEKFGNKANIDLKGLHISGEDIEDGTITQNKLSGSISLPPSPRKYNCLSASGTIGENEAVYTNSLNISKNATYIGRIKGTLENVCFGVGYSPSESDKRTVGSSWITITPSSVTLRKTDASTVVQTFPSEFVIDDETTVMITTSIDSTSNSTFVICVSKIQIFNSKGDIYELVSDNQTNFTRNVWGVGQPFIENNGEESIDAEVKFFPKDLTKSVWVFGDSYLVYKEKNRWTYYYFRDSNFGTLLNNKAGESPSEGITDLTTLLGMGYVPSKVVWCYGMNGERAETKIDGVYTINSGQKAQLDALIGLSHQYGFDVVIATIPTTPIAQRTGYNNYVKSLECRVIDFADAVGADEDGIWHNSPTLFAWRNDTLGVTIYTSKSIDKLLTDTKTSNYVYNNDGTINGSYTINAKNTDNDTIDVNYNGSTYTFMKMNYQNDIVGLISTDMVHPTALGAKVLFSRAVADCPEITINE